MGRLEAADGDPAAAGLDRAVLIPPDLAAAAVCCDVDAVRQLADVASDLKSAGVAIRLRKRDLEMASRRATALRRAAAPSASATGIASAQTTATIAYLFIVRPPTLNKLHPPAILARGRGALGRGLRRGHGQPRTPTTVLGGSTVKASPSKEGSDDVGNGATVRRCHRSRRGGTTGS